jgi:uncharacterized protein
VSMSQPFPSGGVAPTSEERNWAMAAHLGSFVAAYAALGLLAPLLVLLVKGDASPFVRRHAVESLNFQITTLIWVVIGFAVVLFTLGLGIVVVIPIAVVVATFYVVVVIVAGVRAAGGRDYRYPLTWRFVS